MLQLQQDIKRSIDMNLSTIHKTLSASLVAMLVLGGCGGLGTKGNNQQQNGGDTNASASTYLELINNARAQARDCGTQGHFDAAPPLKWNVHLYNAAREHSADMAKSNYMDHPGSGTDNDITAKEENLGRGSIPKERILHNGYPTTYITLGENVEGGTAIDTPQKAIDGWLNSDHHCANIMNPVFTEVGMAKYSNPEATYTNYWTQNFGAQ